MGVLGIGLVAPFVGALLVELLDLLLFGVSELGLGLAFVATAAGDGDGNQEDEEEKRAGRGEMVHKNQRS